MGLSETYFSVDTGMLCGTQQIVLPIRRLPQSRYTSPIPRALQMYLPFRSGRIHVHGTSPPEHLMTACDRSPRGPRRACKGAANRT